MTAALSLLFATPPPPASAKYGDFANMPAESDTAVGDASNECLFARPGTGICTVYKSSEPALWAAPDKAGALKKLVGAARSLDAIGRDIEASRWTAISQALGSSMDLQEAVTFLSSSEADAKSAKKVFGALQGVGVAVQKKNREAARSFFDKYSEAMPALIEQLELSAT